MQRDLSHNKREPSSVVSTVFVYSVSFTLRLPAGENALMELSDESDF